MTETLVTNFASLTKTTPSFVSSLDKKGFVSFFSEFTNVLDKSDNKIHFYGLYKLLPDTTRKAKNVDFYSGLVFDFDNTEHLGKTSPQELEDLLNSEGVFYVCHTTISATSSNECWRLLLPFKVPVSPESYTAVFDCAYALLKEPKGVDPASKTASQIFRMPCSTSSTYKYCGYNLGNYYIDEKLEKDLIQEKIDIDFGDETSYGDICISLEDLREMLFYIPASGYPTWITVGMGIKNKFGESGFSAFHEWSSRGGKSYKGKNDVIEKWNSFKREGRIRIGSIIYFAKKNGYVKDHYQGYFPHTSSGHNGSSNHIYSPKILCDQGSIATDASAKEISNLSFFKEDFLDFKSHNSGYINFKEFSNCDPFDLRSFPFLNSLYNVYKENSIRFCPNLCLGAVLNIAALVFQNVRLEGSNARSNLYTMLLASPGTGKQSIIDTSSKILSHYDLLKITLRDIGTIQGIEKHIKETLGKLFFLLDEAQDFFKVLHHKNVNEHRAAILTFLKKGFGDTTYASPITKGGEKLVIDNLLVNCCFLGVPNTFKFLNMQDFSGGFMSRFLFFLEDIPHEPINYKPCSEVPSRALEFKFFNQIIPSKKIELPDDCNKFMNEFQEFCNKKRFDLTDGKQDSIVRLHELVAKLALLTADKNLKISYQGFLWASSVVALSFNNLLKLMDMYFAKDEYDASIRKLDNILEQFYMQGKEPTARSLRTYFRDIRTSVWWDMLENARARGLIEITDEKQLGNNQVKTVIKHLRK